MFKKSNANYKLKDATHGPLIQTQPHLSAIAYLTPTPRIQHINKQNFDLSSLRIIIDGAEPVSAEVCEEFTNKMTNFNMKSNVVKPSYGLSEATLVVSTPENCDSYTEVLVERKHVRIGQKIIEHEVHSNNSMKFVGRTNTRQYRFQDCG